MNLVNHLASIPDHRRGQGMKYDLGSILLFSIMAVLSGATSYRKIERYIHSHRIRLNELCNINWKRAPAHNSIRYALQGLDAKDVEKSFREHSQELHEDSSAYGSISMDGKVLRGSFDHFEGRKAAQVVSALAAQTNLVLGHIWITDEDGKNSMKFRQYKYL